MIRKSASLSTCRALAVAVADSLTTLTCAIRRVTQQLHNRITLWFESTFVAAPMVCQPSMMEMLENRQMLSSTPAWSTYTASSPASQAPQAVMQMLAPVKMVGSVVSVDGTESSVGAGSVITTNYTWNFGDSSGAYNVLNGYNASHIYNNPGTYTVSLTLTNDLGKTSTASTSITIAADSRKVIYVDSSAGNDSNSGTSTSNPVKTAARADALLGNNTEVLFKRGETFDLTTSFETPYTNVLVGAYGSGALPVLNYTTNDAGVILDTSATTLSVDVTFENLSVTSPSSVTNLPMAVQVRGANIGVVGCVFNHQDYDVNSNGGGLGLLVQDDSSPSATGLEGYFVWDQSPEVTVLGNYVAGTTQQHVFRSEEGSGEMDIAYNNFTNNDGKGDIEIHWGQWGWVDHNTCNGGDIRVGPLGEYGESASSTTTDVVIEANTITNNSLIDVDPGSHDISIRNNYITATTLPMMVLSSGDSQGRTTSDIQILNNTGVCSGSTGSFVVLEEHMSGIYLENNLYIAPNLVPGGYGTAPVYVNDTNLSSFSAINGNVWQLPPNISQFANNGQGVNFVGTSMVPTGYLTPAQWNAAPQVGTDYFVATSYSMSGTAAASIANGNYTLNLSVPVPSSSSIAATVDSSVVGVFTDINGNTRPSTQLSAGAAQVGMSATPAENINLNVTGSNSNAGSGSSPASPPSSSIPSGWTSTDIGSVAVAGSASYSSGTYTLSGSGADISGTADAFHYVYNSLSGNGTIVAEVSNLTDANANAKAGVMLRDGTAANAKEVSITVDPDGNIHFDSRTTTGGNTSASYGSVSSSTAWLELIRNGNTVTGYASSDDKTWKEVGSASLTLDTALQAGMVVTAHDNGAIETANFSNVSLSTSTSAPAASGATSVLPPGMTSADIGSVGETGSAIYDDGTYTISGGGADVSGTADAFHYVYTTLDGNGTIIAEVSDMNDPDTNAKAGLMLRDGTAANAKEVSIFLAPNDIGHADSRTTTGGNTNASYASNLSSTEWLKLVRNGNTVTTYVSSNDSTWTQVSNITLTLDTTVDIGLAVTAHNNGALETANFSSVSLS